MVDLNSRIHHNGKPPYKHTNLNTQNTVLAHLKNVHWFQPITVGWNFKRIHIFKFEIVARLIRIIHIHTNLNSCFLKA